MGRPGYRIGPVGRLSAGTPEDDLRVGHLTALQLGACHSVERDRVRLGVVVPAVRVARVARDGRGRLVEVHVDEARVPVGWRRRELQRARERRLGDGRQRGVERGGVRGVVKHVRPGGVGRAARHRERVERLDAHARPEPDDEGAHALRAHGLEGAQRRGVAAAGRGAPCLLAVGDEEREVAARRIGEPRIARRLGHGRVDGRDAGTARIVRVRGAQRRREQLLDRGLVCGPDGDRNAADHALARGVSLRKELEPEADPVRIRPGELRQRPGRDRPLG